MVLSPARIEKLNAGLKEMGKKEARRKLDMGAFALSKIPYVKAFLSAPEKKDRSTTQGRTEGKAA